MEYKLTKHIIREYELSKLTGELDENLKVLKDFTEDIFNRATIVDTEEGYEVIVDNQTYFKQKNDTLWCNYFKVWSFFKSSELYKYHEISELIHYLVSSTINKEVGTPLYSYTPDHPKVSSTINKEVGTPGKETVKVNLKVSTTINKEVGTPLFAQSLVETGVSTTINREVGTPVAVGEIRTQIVSTTINREVGTPGLSLANADGPVPTTINREVGTPVAVSKRVSNSINYYK